MAQRSKKKDLEALPLNFDNMTKRKKEIIEEAQYRKQMYSKTYGR